MRKGITREELAERIQAIYAKKEKGEPLSKSDERTEAHHVTAKECRCANRRP